MRTTSRRPHASRSAASVNARYDVIAWNSLAAALLEDFSAVPAARRNLVYQHFLHPIRGAGSAT